MTEQSNSTGLTNYHDKLLIVGAGGHGKVVADIARNIGRWKEINFLDDNPDLDILPATRIIGSSNEVMNFIKDWDVFVAIGNNEVREKIISMLEYKGTCIPTLIHPKAVISEQVIVGKGTVIMAGAVINCCSNIGKGVIINTGSTIDHDNYISDYVHISPGVHTAGMVQVGKSTWIGIGATISNNLNIVESCVIGAGAAVIDSITETGTYVGVPARKICYNGRTYEEHTNTCQ